MSNIPMSESASSRLRPRFGVAIVTCLLLFGPGAQASLAPAEATAKARTFLAGLLDPDLGLLPEYRGANVYWLFHDNYLAAKVLRRSHPKIAQTIRSAMDREGIHRSGKIELLFGEVEQPLPFHFYQLKDVRRATDKIIRTEVVTGDVFDGWERYADLLLLASMAETNPPAARQHWDAALRLWDGKGFLDAAARHDQRYSTYKLGLALLAASRLSPPPQPPEGLLVRLLALQADSGGWITDYDASGNKIGLANVETTCLSILGIEAIPSQKATPAK